MEHLTKIIANTRINPNLPTQAFVADFIESGKYDDFLKFLCQLYKPKMDMLNKAMMTRFPGILSAEISGGFFAPLTLGNITGDKESAFIESAKGEGVGIAPAWDAVAPNVKKEMRKKGLFIRLTFPAFKASDIEWGISKLKETVDMVG